MKTEKHLKSAFTLVEMLVVIAIISLVATAVSHAVRGAQRTANAAKCQANLRNLHTAVVAYFADKGHYPLASSYETMSKERDEKTDKIIKYHREHVGWVSWVPTEKSKKRRNTSGKTDWETDRKKSYAEKFYYPANVDPKMEHAIEEGSLFKYVGKDSTSFRCPQHRFSTSGKRVYFSYAMNSWFYSHSRLYVEWEHRKDGWPVNGARNSHDDFNSKTECIPSRMALFIEMEDADDDSKDGREGQNGDENMHHAKVLQGDCVWEWWKTVGLEIGGFPHQKGALAYCNVAFLDGHVVAIPQPPKKSNPQLLEELKKEEWNGHGNLEEVFTTLGRGCY